MQTLARVRMLAARNPILPILTPSQLIFSSDCHFNALFSSFCKPCLLSHVGVAPTVLLHSTDDGNMHVHNGKIMDLLHS